MRKLNGFWKGLIFFLSMLWGSIILYTALWGGFNPMMQGPIYLVFGLVILFSLYPLNKVRSSKTRPSIIDILFILLSIAVCLYAALRYRHFLYHPGERLTIDFYLAIIMLVLILEATRRVVGWIIPIFVFIILGYTLYGDYIPGSWGHGGFTLSWIFHQLYRTPVGYFGMVTSVIISEVAIFLLFGPMLYETGAGEALSNIANFFGGRFRGGAGQVAVIASALFGTISGSAAANVAVDGVVTIPTMKKAGFSKNFAGAVEAAASSGGQIMPPVMGSGAFVMAEFLGVPYLKICVAAIIPAILFYVGIATGVFFKASRLGIDRLPPELIPSARKTFALRSFGLMFFPLFILMTLLVLSLPAQYCCAWALISNLFMFMLLVKKFTWQEMMDRLRSIGEAVTSAISTVAWLLVMIVCIQTIVCLIGFSAIGVKFATLMSIIGAKDFWLALVMAMVATMILGMGLPTVAAYVVGVALIGPSLIGFGLTPLVAHMFVFFFAVISAITPPVCIAIYPAAAISGGNWVLTGFVAMELAIAAYVVPFGFVLDPGLLMQGEPLEILGSIFFGMVGITCLSAGMMGYLFKPMKWYERFISSGVGIWFFISPSSLGRIIGVALIGVELLIHTLLKQKEVKHTNPSIM